LQRRQTLAALAALAAGATLPRAIAQPAGRIPRVGILHFGSAANFRSREEAFRREMRALGYTEGRIHYYSEGGYGQSDLLEQAARTFARERFDAILSSSTLTTTAIARAAPDTPIVAAADEDLVAEGFAESASRPGRNVTGIGAGAVDQLRRQVELLQQAVPRLVRVTAILNPDNATYGRYRARLEAASRPGMRIAFVDARTTGDIERAFGGRPREDAEGVLVMNDGFLYTERRSIAEQASRAKRPAIFPLRGFVEAGGLMSYGPNLEANFARAAHYIDRILKGTRPAEIPIEGPVRLELVLNRDTARLLSLALPADLMKEAAAVVG